MNPLKSVADKFGGGYRLAQLMGKPTSTVRNLIIRDNAKRSHLQEILDLAEEHGLDVKPADFFNPPKSSKGMTNGSAKEE